MGSSSYITNASGVVTQHLEYMPFGEVFVEEHSNSLNSPFKFNGKELDGETGNYYYGARYYDPKLSTFISVDPLAEKTMSAYGYCYNNPVNLVDPSGMSADPPSTHTDRNGNVLATYNDGDNSVYMHKDGTSQAQIDKQRKDKKNTGGAGVKIGNIGGIIDANIIYSNTLSKNMEEAESVYNPFTFKANVRNHGKWDLKSNMQTIYGLANDGKTKFSFEGKLMESQDIGNHHFGAVGKAYGFFTEEFMLKQAGEAQIAAGTSMPEWQLYKDVRVSNFTKSGKHYFTTEKVILPPYGDDPRDQKWIKVGFQYAKEKK